MEHLKQDNGQTMILITVMMGGLILSATAIAGLLMFYQIQQTNNAAASGMAIFAADAAAEQSLESYYHGSPLPATPTDSATPYYTSNITLPNGASGSANIYFNFLESAAPECRGTGTNPGDIVGFCLVSKGVSGSTERVLQSYFSAIQ